MTTTDAQGIVFLEETDPITPFQTTINTLQSATSAAIGSARRGPLYAANETERNAFLTLYGASSTEPLWVDFAGALWRHNGSAWTQAVWSPHTPQLFSPAAASPEVYKFGPGFRSLSDTSPTYSQPVTYHRDIAGYVNLGGVVSVLSNFVGGTVIAWLPPGFRPSATADSNGRRRFSVPYGTAIGKIEVYGDGRIVGDTGTGAGDTISLDGIRFQALG